jgi:D-lactate dehydrogenase
MRIAFFDLEDWEQAELHKGLFEGHSLYLSADPLVEGTLADAADAEIISVFVYSLLNRAVLDRLPKLMSIATRSTGYGHIDLAR